MTERQIVVDESVEESSATQRAERAEQEVARLQAQLAQARKAEPAEPAEARVEARVEEGGEAELRKDSMMDHLLDSLQAGQDIGHYGRLVFAMVARHFMPHKDVLEWLMRDQDFAEADAVNMLRQVEGRGLQSTQTRSTA